MLLFRNKFDDVWYQKLCYEMQNFASNSLDDQMESREELAGRISFVSIGSFVVRPASGFQTLKFKVNKLNYAPIESALRPSVLDCILWNSKNEFKCC